ncbi:cytidine deaminase-like protein [Sodiomyces alkalinus F11]|uniref:Cytidine deaminase-like protein n=1 Tax=Sodiomyces alkalinus (strain CBS 110278 / VKM F-3762 / F11) TaxID=1314773 RepID=A0A3N2Q0L6_SODAK|nr:cytidine deaminase-like protein [Sodiomyces alkalinus F11]ROT40307.1 cytidine deaminase-like protein [Sodiomyces alkalinus F11]
MMSNNFGAASEASSEKLPEPTGPDVVQPHALIDDLPKQLGGGVLVPLKTTLEIRQDHTVVRAYITRAPTKAANDIITMLRTRVQETNSLPHLRRCAKPGDLPVHLKAQFMNETAESRQVHTGKSVWLYILLCQESECGRDEILQLLSEVEGLGNNVFLRSIPVPLIPPTSQIQAAMWTSQFWPCVYRKNNPLGPHPALVGRASEVMKDETGLWMSLAHRVAHSVHAAGMGEPMGCVIVQRENGKSELVAIAGDARWHQQPNRLGTGNPMAHCVLRAISMVAQKLVRHERTKAGLPFVQPTLEFDCFEDKPLVEEERMLFNGEHPNSEGYLCHGLELYTTHEPCVQCSMAILHSRMAKIVFCHRMPLTGGIASEQRGENKPELAEYGGGNGLGLFWRRELNWSLLAWEWEARDKIKHLPPVAHMAHA